MQQDCRYTLLFYFSRRAHAASDPEKYHLEVARQEFQGSKDLKW
jgi:hypothetical protein